VPAVHSDVPVSVRVESLGGRMLTGKIARVTDKVDESTRTMTAEMEVDNHSLGLVPGMYATVILKVDAHAHVLAVPIEAVPSGGKTVFVVNAAHQVEERAVKVGMETPTKYEIVSGLNEGDLVVVGNAAQLRAGQKVEARTTEPLVRQ
jgi:RND family efflux transporter MFP subunit